jgi:hypothetical protein
MNFTDILDLHRAVSAFPFETPANRPKLYVYDTQDKGEEYSLYIRISPGNEKYFVFVKSVAETRKLGIKKFRDYLVLYSWHI